MAEFATLPEDEASLRTVVVELLREVQALKEQIADTEVDTRLGDVEEQLVELSTEVRLQARRSNLAVSQLHLNLGQVASHSNSGSPRVAGLLSPATAVTPRADSLSGLSAAPASPRSAADSIHTTPRSHRDTSRQHAAAKSSSPAGQAAFVGVATPRGVGFRVQVAGEEQPQDAAHGGSASTPPQKNGGLGVFDTMKNWKEDALDTSDLVQQARQAAEQAATAAAEAAAASSRCQQQVLELRGRQGQAERRLDTLWQLQEAAGQNQATLTRLQQDLQQTQQHLLQQQHNMSALQAQVQQLDSRCESNNSNGKQLQAQFLELQGQLDVTERELRQLQDGLLQQHHAAEAANARLQEQLQQQRQHLGGRLDQQQQMLDTCSRKGHDALDKCEQLRQTSVVMDRRLDGVAAQIRDAVQPVAQRLSAVESSMSTVTAAAATCSTAVQQHQLSTALAQLSAAAVRQQQETKAILSGLAHRMELLESDAARHEQVVSKDGFEQQLQQLHADIEVAILQATSPLVGQLKAKADTAQLSSSSSNLTNRMNTSEQQLLLGLKSVGDKTAALLQHKADAAAVEEWRQAIADEITQLRIDVAQVLQTPASNQQQRASSVGRLLRSVNVSAPAAQESSSSKAAQSHLQLAGAITSSKQQQREAAEEAMQPSTVAECAAAAAAALVSEAEDGASEPVSPDAALLPPETDPPPVVEQQPAVPPASRKQTAAARQRAEPKAAAAAVEQTDDGITAMVLRPLTGTHKGSGKGSGNSSTRPMSSVQPWAGSPVSGNSSAGELHSAAQNAKLAKAARDKELARNKAVLSKGSVSALIYTHSAPPAPEGVAEALQQQLNVMGLKSPAGSRRGGIVGLDAGLSGSADTEAPADASSDPGTAFNSVDGDGRLIPTTAPAGGKPSKLGGQLRSSSAGAVAAAAAQRQSNAEAEAQQQREKLPLLHVQSPTADDLRALLRNSSTGSVRPGSAVAALKMPALGAAASTSSGQQILTASPADSMRGGSTPTN